MSLQTEWVRYGADQTHLGYFAKPANIKGPLPAVIVIQEIWGVDEHIQDVTRRFAQAGYAAMAPDLYAEHGSRPAALGQERVSAVKNFLETLPPTAWGNADERDAAIAKLPEAEQQQIRETFGTLFGGLNRDLYAEKLLATAAHLRNECEQTKGQPVGSIGFCMGGALSAVLACKDDELKAAVVFYGNAPDTNLIQNVRCPVMGFYGELDTRITDTVPDFARAMKDAGKQFEYHIYSGAHHAFFNDTRASYNVNAARDAFSRVLAFFNQQLA